VVPFFIAAAFFSFTCYAQDNPQNIFSLPAAYAPWRETYYATSISKELPAEQTSGCPFCREIATDNDEQYYILARTQQCAIILNKFPYTKGHILIIPYEHSGSLSDLSPATRAEMMELATQAISLISATFNCQGFNVGFNIGNCSGASIPDHVHMQVVPRYKGNLSFMHTIAKTDVICYDIEKVYEKLRAQFNDLNQLR